MLQPNTIYILIILLVGTACTTKPESDAIKGPTELLGQINSNSRYLTTHQVAKRIIERDPSILLIDVRTIYENEEYNIPGSFNIPLEEILNPDWQAYIDQEAMDIVFYSNSDVFAEQAWMLSTQKAYNNLYVMTGGLNEWFRTIIQPVPPNETAALEMFELYSFERAASIYFGGTTAADVTKPRAKKKVTIRKKEKKATEGGC